MPFLHFARPRWGVSVAFLQSALWGLPANAAPSAAPQPVEVPTPQEIVAAAPDSDWRRPDPGRLLVMTLQDRRKVVLELAPDFAPEHVAAIVALARRRGWDGGAITRVQDGYVTQWAAKAPGAATPLAPEYTRALGDLRVNWLAAPDAYAGRTGFVDGWPVGSDGHQVWLAHCYGMVGAGRDMPPNTGDGSELYVVIGQAPRQLDRNIALVGRVLTGMDALSALPRGSGDMGFYTPQERRPPLLSVVLAADLPEEQRPKLQVMGTETASFARYLDARANRRDPFYVRPAGGVDLCNVPVPVRAGR